MKLTLLRNVQRLVHARGKETLSRTKERLEAKRKRGTSAVDSKVSSQANVLISGRTLSPFGQSANSAFMRRVIIQ